MINAVIASISSVLYSAFGYENYMEEIKQDFKEPCFFIECISPSVKKFPGNRMQKQCQFCVHYFPESKSRPKEECYTVAETLEILLETIPLNGKPVRGTDMHYEVSDGVLVFFVNYNCFFTRLEDKTKFGTMHSETHVKG